MPAVGSDAWVAAFAAAVPRTAAAATAERLVVQQEITDRGGAWHVVADGDSVAVLAGRHPSPDVTFRQDAATADAINAGRLTAQQAFIDGRLVVSGAVERLIEAAAALASLPSVPAGG